MHSTNNRYASMRQNQNMAFDFEAHNVRVIQENDGAPWFNVKDVCAALELSNPHQAIKTHVDTDDLQKMEVIDAMGRKQPTNHVNESGLYSLILTSRKPAAQCFKRWITSEVLPSLRKTGAYAHPAAPAVAAPAATALLADSLQSRVAALLAIGETMARTRGISPGAAMSAALDAIQSGTGIDVTPFRRALPSPTDPVHATSGLLPAPNSCDDPFALVDPSQIAAALAIGTAEVNARLEEIGLQSRHGRGEWELTEEGAEWGNVAPYVKGELRPHSLLWRQEVIELMLEEAA